MENAVIYARYSSQGQNEQSIDEQLRINNEFAASKQKSSVYTPTKPKRERTTTAPTFSV